MLFRTVDRISRLVCQMYIESSVYEYCLTLLHQGLQLNLFRVILRCLCLANGKIVFSDQYLRSNRRRIVTATVCVALMTSIFVVNADTVESHSLQYFVPLQFLQVYWFECTMSRHCEKVSTTVSKRMCGQVILGVALDESRGFSMK